MITGTAPLVALWLIVGGSWLAVGLHLTTPWWRSPVGQHLLVYLAILAVWYTELLVGSYAYSPAVETVEAVTFLTMPVAIWWRAGLMTYLRLRRRRPAA